MKENELVSKRVKKHIYRKIFCDEFNISFHKPKKDQCAVCERYLNLTEEGKTEGETRVVTEHKEMK